MPSDLPRHRVSSAKCSASSPPPSHSGTSDATAAFVKRVLSGELSRHQLPEDLDAWRFLNPLPGLPEDLESFFYVAQIIRARAERSDQ
jgi:hypothetical protein